MRYGYLLLLLIAKSAAAQTFTKVAGSAATPNSLTSWGVSWVDIDGDTDLDLYVNDKDQHRLFRNDGSGTFTNNTPAALASPDPLGFYYTAAWGDLDNDGYIDLYLGNDGDKSALFKGSAAGFTQVTTGPAVTDKTHAWQVSFVDYNRDGFLDLYRANLSSASPEAHNLYRSNAGSTFSKISTGAIVTDVDETWAHAWADYNGDRCPDLWVGAVTNDRLYRNNCDGTFTKVASGPMVTDGKDSQSGSWGDYDNDGDLDLFVSVWDDKSILYRNDGGGTFTKITSGPLAVAVNKATGSGWADWDLDGDLDLFVCTWDGQKDRAYSNNGDGTFTEVNSGPLVDEALSTNGCAWGDYDGDGDPDLYVTNRSTANHLFRNETTGKSWLSVRVKGGLSNFSGIGAKVRAKATIGGVPTWQMREIGGMGGQFAPATLVAQFGFGDATIIDSLKVEWPSGADCYFTAVPVNSAIAVWEEGCARMPASVAVLASAQGFVTTAAPNPFQESTTIFYSLPASAEVVLTVTDAVGRIVLRRSAAGAQREGKFELSKAGFPAPGTYFYTLQAGGAATTGSFIFQGK